MTQRFRIFVQGVAALTVVFPAHAHHAMDYRLPATALEGLLSGLGHPIIGIDHLLFILGAGVLAARLERGHWLPFLFVFASMLAAAARVSGAPWEMSELWIAGSLIVLGGTAITAGANVYWDNAADQATTNAAAGANKLIGKTVLAAADADEYVRVRLNQ